MVLCDAGIRPACCATAVVDVADFESGLPELSVKSIDIIHWVRRSLRFPDNALAKLEELAATLPVSSYLIDDSTTLKITNGTIEVISERQWKLLSV